MNMKKYNVSKREIGMIKVDENISKLEDEIVQKIMNDLNKCENKKEYMKQLQELMNKITGANDNLSKNMSIFDSII